MGGMKAVLKAEFCTMPSYPRVLIQTLLSAQGLWGRVFGGRKAPAPSVTAAKGTDAASIHVFTVATGHMYERLQKIMFLSVIKNTKSRRAAARCCAMLCPFT